MRAFNVPIYFYHVGNPVAIIRLNISTTGLKYECKKDATKIAKELMKGDKLFTRFAIGQIIPVEKEPSTVYNKLRYF